MKQRNQIDNKLLREAGVELMNKKQNASWQYYPRQFDDWLDAM